MTELVLVEKKEKVSFLNCFTHGKWPSVVGRGGQKLIEPTQKAKGKSRCPFELLLSPFSCIYIFKVIQSKSLHF